MWIRWTGLVDRLLETRNIYKILVVKYLGKHRLGRWVEEEGE
jgi:hypothetical protein